MPDVFCQCVDAASLAHALSCVKLGSATAQSRVKQWRSVLSSFPCQMFFPCLFTLLLLFATSGAFQGPGQFNVAAVAGKTLATLVNAGCFLADGQHFLLFPPFLQSLPATRSIPGSRRGSAARALFFGCALGLKHAERAMGRAFSYPKTGAG